mgnify:CR=1 FL=1
MSKRPGDPGYADGWCVHYRSNRSRNPDGPDICEAGVDYRTFDNIKFQQRPCFLDKGSSKPGAVSCQRLRLPTAEEIATHEKWRKDRMSLLGTVMNGIVSWRKKNKGRSTVEIVECPACKGRLHLSIAAYNGHVHGKCETQGWVSWME